MADELVSIGADLIGQTVRNAARPECGDGKVLRVQQLTGGASPTYRVSVQFSIGHRHLIVPPARIIVPRPEPTRASGWLARASNDTLDDKLRGLPEQVVNVLGTPRERLAAALPLYTYTDESESLLKWARNQTGVADALSHWNRDELDVAFAAFCSERDAHFRAMAALVQQSEGPAALTALLDGLPATLKTAVREALSRVI
ncbi:MAG: hypothetical protein JXO22_01125 [Phycisphaerae bacterium]|nr:hypothetical protein [Phycisphaerae bacterium]